MSAPTERLGRDELYLFMALLVSKRSTCVRRDVGCILVDKRGHVLATGYNGVPSGVSHCKGSRGVPCAGAFSESGTDLDRCLATHAEANALLQCRDVWEIASAYCTTLPCTGCLKLLRNTSCQRIFYSEGYPSPEADRLWAGEMVHMPLEQLEECLENIM